MDTSALSRWIVEHATGGDDWASLLDGVCRALVEMGLPLWRVAVTLLTLDPSNRAFSLNWYMDGGIAAPTLAPRGAETDAVYQHSPVGALVPRGERSGRWRLDALRDDDFPLLHPPAAGGAFRRCGRARCCRS